MIMIENIWKSDLIWMITYLRNLVVLVRAIIFHEGNKCYPEVLLDERLYKLWIIKKNAIHDRIDVSEWVGIDRKSASKEC